MKKSELTIIIPVFNEKKTLPTLLTKIFSIKLSKQIIIIDDKSTDGTSQIISKYKKRINKIIYHKKNMGKGAAIKSAQKFIKGEYVIIQDADLEYDPKDYLNLLDKIKKENLKVVYGSRVLKKNRIRNLQNFSHRIRIYGNIFLTHISNLINRQNLTDAHTCYKLFRSKIFKKINLKENGFSFCPEITTKLSLLKINIKEIPISYNGRTYEEGKKIVAFDGVRAIITLLKYRYFNV
ncbi:glycosyltransferase family 2 protein [Candidatus Pelagibacter ubique]|nr:glycosyltransferase family 2 protein [Candidatus Pelagibacter ubique]